MNRLLSGKFDPVTTGWGFLETSFDTAAAFMTDWLRQIRHVDQPESFEGSLDDGLTGLGAAGQNRVLLSSTRSRWTAVFVDRKDAGLSEVAHPSKALPCRAVELVWVDHTFDPRARTGDMGCVRFQTFAAHRPCSIDFERFVDVSADSPGWEFEETGTPYPFEDLARYRARRIRDRFTPDMLAAYCKEFGIDAFDADFYGPRFALFVPVPRSLVMG